MADPRKETKQLALEKDRDTRRDSSAGMADAGTKEEKSSYWSDIREGWSYIVSHAPVATILVTNVLWATGGGAINLISDRLGGIVFAGERGISGDSAVAALYFASGLGLFIGMMIARRVGSHFEFLGRTVGFIGWSLVAQGLLCALIGLMPGLWLACLVLFMSRIVLGAEFAVGNSVNAFGS